MANELAREKVYVGNRLIPPRLNAFTKLQPNSGYYPGNGLEGAGEVINSIMSSPVVPYQGGADITMGDVAGLAPYFTPGLGDALDAADAYNAYQRGDIKNAMVSGAAAVLPFVTSAGALGLMHRLSGSADNLSGVAKMYPDQVGAIAYHGSPHKFGKFSMDKIGTGEGAQAYGHGLYFAENPSVARGYKTSTSYQDVVRQFRKELPDDAGFDELADMAKEGLFSKKQNEVLKALADDDWLGFDYPSQAITAAFRDLDNYDPSPALRKAIEEYGNLYKVDIADDAVKNFLDWDKPLSEQPHIKKMLSDMGIDIDDVIKSPIHKETTGGDLIQWLGAQNTGNMRSFESDPLESKRISRLLDKAGIKGIKYLDQGSRTAGKGTSNYVVFDDKLIKILNNE